jgi:hypothetical protein
VASVLQMIPMLNVLLPKQPLLQENSLRGLVRQLSIDQLDNEGRRVSIYEKTTADKSPLFTRSMSAPVGA